MAQCDYCDGEMLTVTGCTHRTYTIEGLEYPAVRAEPHPDTRECHDCGALRGEAHHPGCDMETCPHCGGQLISCGHAQEAFDSMESGSNE